MKLLLNRPALLFLFIFFGSNFSFGQGCENSDFEYGSFTNWNGYTGVCCGGLITTPGIVSGRHTIITTSSLDPNTNNNISTMPPIGGGAYSVRLGNDNVGSEAERLVRSFTVSAANQLFIYQYALVLQDPEGHPPIDKPKFEVRIFDENGDIIDPYECGYYQVTAGPETDSWGQYNDVRYKDWSTVGIDLSAYLGTLITIEFTVQDCGWGGHYGYAYLDATCGFLDIEVIGFCEGSTTVTLIAPDGFDQYFWPHSGETTQVVTIPTPNVGDSVIVEVTNQSGCATSILHIFEEYPLIDATAGNDTLVCVGQPVDLWAGGAGQGGNYDWYADGQLYSNDQFITVTPLQTTNYELIVSNANGCFSPDSSANVLVQVNDTLLFALPNDTLICLGESLTIDGPLGNFSYFWYTNYGDTLGNTSSITVAPLDSTTFFLQISNSSCTFTDSLVLGVNNAATLPDTIINDFCIGETQITISGPDSYASYLWEDGTTTQDISINPYVDTLLQLNLISTYGCPDSVIYLTNETIAPIPIVSALNDTLCRGQNTVLSASSTATDYIWTSIPAGYNDNGSSTVITPDSTTTYVVQAISSVGCTDQTSFDTITIVVDTTAYFELGPDLEICLGDSATLTGPGSMLVYEWFTDGSNVSADPSIVVTPQFSQYYYLTTYSQSCSFTDYVNLVVNDVVTFSTPVYSCITNSFVVLDAPLGYVSVYWPHFNNSNTSNLLSNPQENQMIEVYATNTSGCVDTCQLIIDIIDPSVINPLISETICFGDAISLTASSSYPFDEYQWTSIPAGTNSQGAQLNATPTSSVTYLVTLSNPYDCVGTPSTASADITVLDDHVIPPIAAITVCYGEEVTIPSPGSIGNYTWNYGSLQSTDVSFSFTATQSGFVNLTVVNGPCSDSQTVPITVNNPQNYIIQATPQVICVGEETTLTLNPNSFISAEWFVNGTWLGTANGLQVSPGSTTTYSALVMDNNGCLFDASYQVVVYPLPLVNLGPDQIICAKTSTVLYSAATPSSADYLWSTSESAPSITVNATGMYSVIVEDNNCISSDEVYVEFNPYSFMGQIPNIITANGDLINDEFFFESENVEEFSLVIINRWGNTIYETDDYTKYWDGTSKNKEVEQGVYFYKITYRLACEQIINEIHGHVTVSK